MLIVFLDFDGVLNRVPGQPWEPDLVERLNLITDLTGAKIVVHSSWRWKRNLTQLREVLRTFHRGVPVTGEVISACKPPGQLRVRKDLPISSRRDRPLAIQTWLDDHFTWVNKYVILDDSPDLGHFVGTPEFIQTDGFKGITDEQAQQAIHHLKGDTW